MCIFTSVPNAYTAALLPMKYAAVAYLAFEAFPLP